MSSRSATRPIHSLRRATKGFHRIAAVGVAIAGALASYTTTDAEPGRRASRTPNRNISHIANMRELIRYASGAPEPSTECALSTVTCVGPGGNWVSTAQTALDAGQNVYLTDGDLATEDDYLFPLPNTPILILDSSDRIYGEGPFNTTVRRDGTNVIFGVKGDGNTIEDVTLIDASEFIKMFGLYNNIAINNIHARGAGANYLAFNKSDLKGNNAPNIWVTNSLFDGGQLVIHFNDQGFPETVGPNTKYVGIDSCTFRNITNKIGTGLIIDAPLDRVNDVYLGSGDITNSTMIDSDNNWTDEFLINISGGNAAGATNAPSNMIEWNVTGDTLADHGVGINNKEVNPRLTKHGRPIDLPPFYVPAAMRVGVRFCSSSIACWGRRSVAEPGPTGVALALPTSPVRPLTVTANAAGVS